MEKIETRVDHSFRIDSTDPCQLFGCSFHSYSFIIDTHGNLFSFDFENLISLPVESITQIAVSCEKENGCEYYFLTKSGSVYLWTVNNRPAKKLKLEGSKSNYELQKIRDKVYYIASAVPNGIYLFSEQQCEIYQQGTFHITELGGISSKVACHCFFQYLDPSFGEFFSIKDKGFIYGTTSGEIFFRDTSNASCAQDARLIVLEDNEKVMHVELAHIEELCYLLAIGHLGTIMIYYKHFGEGAMNFRQFNIQFPVNLVDKIQELNYAISINVGKVSFLKFKLDQGNIILESKPFQHLTQISNLRVLDQSTLEVLTKAFEYQKIKYDLQTISAENDPQIIRTLIKDALEELAISETALKQIEEEEEDLSRKLASVNQTLYAIQSINSKRKKGIPNSLEDTGFEFTLCPVVKSTSLANICLQPTTYLRACIKTNKFLQLESWYLALDLFSENNITGETKTLPVVGFESHYEQGLERYSVWERDVSIEPSQLPLKVTCALVMNSLNEPLRFPVAEMMVDDIHFAMPCNTDLIQSIQRRGLDDVSRELNESYTRQILLDKTGSYPFARFLRKQNSSQQITKRSFYNNKHVHIRCLIDPSMTDEQYRSILPNLLNEGRTVDEVKLIMNNAEQAYLTLASFPSSPIILLLSKVAVNELDITIQSAHPSALFKTEANLILRLSRCIKDENQSMNLSKKLKFLEDSVVELQEIYQQDNMEIDNDDNHLTNSIKQIIERLYNTYDELPIGFVKFA